MRIGIDARFLTHPQEGGFKTYTENIVHGLSAFDQRNEYILYTDRPWHDSIHLGPNFRVKTIGGPGPVREQISLPMAMAQDRLDVAHFLCNTAPLVHRSKSVLTVHDIIPCISCGPVQAGGGKFNALARYWRCVMPRAARRANQVITISQASKSDICTVFDVPESRITVVPTGLHPDFQPVIDQEELDRIHESYHLPNRFIMGFISSDPRKNSSRLLAAASIVESNLPDVGLVLVCASDAARELVLEVSARRDLPLPRITLISHVPRKDLVVLYNLAEAVAFPSLYEGFGLPVIEAMACGTPLVTSNVSSLPEVAGDAALLVDPTDTDALAEALTAIMINQTLRAQLIAKGIHRAALFSWERTAQETIAVYERIASGSRCASNITEADNRTAGGSPR